MASRTLRIGTRASQLALWQANHIKALLAEKAGIDAELVIIESTGDKDQISSLADTGAVGAFTREISELSGVKPGGRAKALRRLREEHDLDELPHTRGVVVTSAGVMPPLAEPETIKTVCEWVCNYPPRQ